MFGGLAFFCFEGERLLSRLTPKIEKELGRYIKSNVRIGDLDITFYPRFGIAINSLSIKPENSCGAISAEHGSLSLDLVSLIHGDYLIDSLSIVSARASIYIRDGVPGLVDVSDINCNKSSLSVQPTQIPFTDPLAKEGEVQESMNNFPLILKLEKLEIEDARIFFIGAKEHEINISRLSTSVSLESGVIKLIAPDLEASIDSIPFSMQAKEANVDLHTKALTLVSADLSMIDQSIKMNGKFQSAQKMQNVEIQAKELKLSKLMPVLKLFNINMPNITSGAIVASVIVNSAEDTGLEVRGDLLLKNFNLPAKNLKTTDLQLKSLIFKHSPNAVSELSALTTLKNFTVNNGEYQYVVKKVEGPIRLRRDENDSNCTGELLVTGFEYRDGLTEIRNVSGRLSKFTGTLAKKGDVKVTTNLDSSSIELMNPAIEVRAVKNLSAPLTILIPKDGVYSVAGLASAEGGALLVSGREFKEVSGKVKLYISTLKKEFEALKLSTDVMGRKLSSRGTFLMSPDSYLLKGFQTSLHKGEIKIDGQILRDKERKFSTTFTIANVLVADLNALIQNSEEKLMDGTIGLLTSTLDGSLVNPRESVRGKGSFKLLGTKLEGFDLSRAVGKALSAIPLANIKLSPEELNDDQKTKTADGEFLVENQMIHFSKATFYRTNYTLQARGKLSFTKELDAQGSVIFAQKTMKKLGGGFERLGALIGKMGKVEIPLFIKGKLPDFSVSIDLETFVRDNSGVTLAGDIIGTTLKAGKSVKNFILKPFRSEKNQKSKN